MIVINIRGDIMQHPNLYFTGNDITDFRKRLKTDAVLRARYEAQTAKVEEYLAEDFITEAQANGRNTQSQHADFGSINGQANRLCSSLGVKYAVDGDMRCAKRLKELLFHLIKFERWFGVSYTVRKPVPWHSDLCSTAITLALANIYDIIYDSLTIDERIIIADGILDKGVYPTLGDWVLPETRIHAVDSMGHNWWAVCISRAACAFLVLCDGVDAEKRKEVLDLINSSLADYLTYPGNRLFNKVRNFDEQGLFYESVGYNNFGTGSLLHYLWCSERYFGRNEIIRNSLPEDLCDGVLNLCYPCTQNGKLLYAFPDFGDSGFDMHIDFLAKYALLNGIDTPALRAYAANEGNDIFDEIRADYYPQKLKGELSYLPLSKVYSSGFALKRASWELNSTLFAVKSGYCWNHSHNDSGSFIIFHKGKPFFIDSGTCIYDFPEYHDYYCQDCAHSVLKIGGRGRRDEELYRGTRFPGSITDSFESEGLFYVQADSTGPMAHLCSRMYRNFLWLDNRILVIFDDVYAHEANSVQFTLHFNGEFKQNGNAVDFSYDDCHARLISHSPEMCFTEKQGHTDHKQNEYMPYIELSTAAEKRAHILIHTLELDFNEYHTEYRLLESENAVGIRITEDDTEREIWFNICADGHIMHDNSNNLIAGFDTDAYMLVITKDRKKNTEKVLTICGSFLRKDGKVYFSSFIKKTNETEIKL